MCYNMHIEEKGDVTDVEKLFTVQEVAEIFNVSARSVRNQIKAGKLKANKYYITEGDMQEWLKQARNFTTPMNFQE